MEGVVADLMSIHPMEGYVVVVTQLGSVVLPSGEDVHYIGVNKLTVQACNNTVMDPVGDVKTIQIFNWLPIINV